MKATSKYSNLKHLEVGWAVFHEDISYFGIMLKLRSSSPFLPPPRVSFPPNSDRHHSPFFGRRLSPSLSLRLINFRHSVGRAVRFQFDDPPDWGGDQQADSLGRPPLLDGDKICYLIHSSAQLEGWTRAPWTRQTSVVLASIGYESLSIVFDYMCTFS